MKEPEAETPIFEPRAIVYDEDGNVVRTEGWKRIDPPPKVTFTYDAED